MELNENVIMSAYSKNIFILGNNFQEVIHTVKKLIASNPEYGPYN